MKILAVENQPIIPFKAMLTPVALCDLATGQAIKTLASSTFFMTMVEVSAFPSGILTSS